MSGDARCRARGHQRLAAVWSEVGADVVRYLNKSPENQAAGDTLKTRLGALLTPQLLCLVVHRLAHRLSARGWRRGATLLARLNFLVHKVSIAPESCIGPGCFLPHPAGVVFCGRAGSELTLYSLAVCAPFETSLDGPLEAAPRLGDRVTVGGRAVVLGPVQVGDDVRLFGVRIDQDVPAGRVVSCRVLRPSQRERSTPPEVAEAPA